MEQILVMVLGAALALAVVGWTVASQRLAMRERELKTRASTMRVLADLVAGRR